MASKPLEGLLGHLLKRSRFFEQMCGARDDHELLGTLEKPVRILIHLDDRVIFTADEEEGGRSDLRQIAFG